MRTMLRFSIPVDKGNAAIKDGSLPKVMGNVLETLKPEAAYFFTENGRRSGFLVIDLKDATDIPRIAEPFFMQLDAEVSFAPVMNAQDLQAGLAKLK